MTFFPKAKLHDPTESEKAHKAYMNGLQLGREGKDSNSWNPYPPFGPFKRLYERCAEGFRHAETF